MQCPKSVELSVRWRIRAKIWTVSGSWRSTLIGSCRTVHTPLRKTLGAQQPASAFRLRCLHLPGRCLPNGRRSDAFVRTRLWRCQQRQDLRQAVCDLRQHRRSKMTVVTTQHSHTATVILPTHTQLRCRWVRSVNVNFASQLSSAACSA